MADNLCISQSSYSRLEHSDRKCERKVDRLAHIFGMSVEALRQYGGTTVNAPADPALQQQMTQQQTVITAQAEEISFLRRQLDQMQAYIASLMRRREGGGNSLIISE